MDENQESPIDSGGKFNPLVLVAVLAVVLVGAGFYLFRNNKSAVENTPIAEEQLANEITVIQIEGGSFYFKPNQIRVKIGEPVKIILNSVGGMPHDFVVDELNVRSERAIDGQTEVTFTPDKVGEFEFYCSVGQHRANGMTGTLIVE